MSKAARRKKAAPAVEAPRAAVPPLVAPPSPDPPPATRDAAIDAACPLCAAGHSPAWQAHSGEWVHRRVTLQTRGTQFSISLCGANALIGPPP